MTDETTFIYKDETTGHIEVKKTGRYSTTTIKGVGVNLDKERKLVEIEPVKLSDGRWKKFVSILDINEILIGDA